MLVPNQHPVCAFFDKKLKMTLIKILFKKIFAYLNANLNWHDISTATSTFQKLNHLSKKKKNKQLKKLSLRVRKESMIVNKEFSRIEDDFPYHRLS